MKPGTPIFMKLQSTDTNLIATFISSEYGRIKCTFPFQVHTTTQGMGAQSPALAVILVPWVPSMRLLKETFSIDEANLVLTTEAPEGLKESYDHVVSIIKRQEQNLDTNGESEYSPIFERYSTMDEISRQLMGDDENENEDEDGEEDIDLSQGDENEPIHSPKRYLN